MITLKSSELTAAELQNYLQYAIAPRPICLASTIDVEGHVNLSPFSFFNMFSINPPICVFSPSRRVRDNTTKHTLENIKLVPECVINIVNYDMVQQTSLSSVEYPKGTDEFVKSGLTPVESVLVKPPRVAQSPVQLECIIKNIISLGEAAGSGNMVIAEVKLIHINPAILDANQKIDQEKIDLVARLGGDWYCRVTKETLFKVTKPNRNIGIGVDALPVSIRQSSILTGNDLGQLGNVESLPDETSINSYCTQNEELQKLLLSTKNNTILRREALHSLAKTLLITSNVEEAWKVLLADDELNKED
ncbi:flavin reductase family protein [Paradesertivirga mongoliensis]|uniref:Flavin reductase family protein n=1 Tax=Paradesertivirga mongoliensis TaxID=2100740 RepID=A0ABW4ZI58_9SPHI|nr:flavin reductase family protein [Pedobacter mongoliensis]